jgi:hypothetical protein
MQKFIENVMFGLAFGIGFCIAFGVLWLIRTVLAGAHVPAIAP